MSSRQPKALTLYMCGVAWQHEAEADAEGTPLFPSIKALKAVRPCWKDCGIVSVRVRLKRWEAKQKLLRKRKWR